MVVEPTTGPDGMQRLMAGLAARALPAVTRLIINQTHVGGAGALALANALGQGAMPRLEHLALTNAGIDNFGMVALAPAMKQLPALESLNVAGNTFSDDGLAALVAPLAPAAAGAPPPPPPGPLPTLTWLNVSYTRIADTSALVSAFRNGALPALQRLFVEGTPADRIKKIRVYAARPGVRGSLTQPWHLVAAIATGMGFDLLT